MVQVVSVPEARRASLVNSRNVLASLQFPGDTVDPNVRGHPPVCSTHHESHAPQIDHTPSERVSHTSLISAQIALLASIQPSAADMRRRNSRDGIVVDPLMFGIPSA